MNYRDEVRQIEQRINSRAPEHQVQPSLDRVIDALDMMGNPQHSYATVHITGTNGKTSTARMTDRLIASLGLRTGRFTSPHLTNVRERICIDDELISEEDFVQAWKDCEPFIALADEHSRAVGGPQLSFFEVYTLMGFQAFASAPVDVAVVEVGMGGRWDATNVLDSRTAVLTPISHDHERWLGHDLTEIATEKAGIIAPGATVVVGRQTEEVLKVIREEASRKDAVLRIWDEDIRVLHRQIGVGGQVITVQTPAAVYEDIALPLFGEHQAMNAAMALSAVEAMQGGSALPAEVVEEAFLEVRSPGRLEIVKQSPTVLVDAAHNPDGARVLRKALEESFAFEKVYGVFSAMQDKNVEAVLGEMEPLLDELVVTQMDSPRAMNLDELKEIAQDVFGEDRVHSCPGAVEALDLAVALSQNTPSALTANGVIIFGSVVLAGMGRHMCGLD